MTHSGRGEAAFSLGWRQGCWLVAETGRPFLQQSQMKEKKRADCAGRVAESVACEVMTWKGYGVS